MDWLTLDGSVRYEMVLLELLSVLCEMRLGGVIYVVGDMSKGINNGLLCGVEKIVLIFNENLERHVDSVMGKEIWYLIVKRELRVSVPSPLFPPPSPLDSSSSSQPSSSSSSSSSSQSSTESSPSC